MLNNEKKRSTCYPGEERPAWSPREPAKESEEFGLTLDVGPIYACTHVSG